MSLACAITVYLTLNTFFIVFNSNGDFHIFNREIIKMIRYIFLGLGAIFYLLAFYLILFNDPYQDTALFQLVQDNNFNFLYAFLSAVAFSVMGTGFLLMTLFWGERQK